MKKLSLIVLFVQLSLLLFSFQNCSPAFKSKELNNSASLNLAGESLQITVSGKSRFFAELGKIIPILIEAQKEFQINPQASTFRATRGACAAKVTLPICELRKMKWKANILLKDSTSDYSSAVFFFATKD